MSFNSLIDNDSTRVSSSKGKDYNRNCDTTYSSDKDSTSSSDVKSKNSSAQPMPIPRQFDTFDKILDFGLQEQPPLPLDLTVGTTPHSGQQLTIELPTQGLDCLDHISSELGNLQKLLKSGVYSQPSQNSAQSFTSDSLVSYTSKISYLNSDIYREYSENSVGFDQFNPVLETCEDSTSPLDMHNTDIDFYTETEVDEDNDINLDDTEHNLSSELTSNVSQQNFDILSDLHFAQANLGKYPTSGTNITVPCEICQDDSDLIEIPSDLYGMAYSWKAGVSVEKTKLDQEIVSNVHYTIAPCFHIYHTSCFNVWKSSNGFCPTCKQYIDVYDESPLPSL